MVYTYSLSWTARDLTGIIVATGWWGAPAAKYFAQPPIRRFVSVDAIGFGLCRIFFSLSWIYDCVSPPPLFRHLYESIDWISFYRWIKLTIWHFRFVCQIRITSAAGQFMLQRIWFVQRLWNVLLLTHIRFPTALPVTRIPWLVYNTKHRRAEKKIIPLKRSLHHSVFPIFFLHRFYGLICQVLCNTTANQYSSSTHILSIAHSSSRAYLHFICRNWFARRTDSTYYFRTRFTRFILRRIHTYLIRDCGQRWNTYTAHNIPYLNTFNVAQHAVCFVYVFVALIGSRTPPYRIDDMLVALITCVYMLAIWHDMHVLACRFCGYYLFYTNK